MAAKPETPSDDRFREIALEEPATTRHQLEEQVGLLCHEAGMAQGEARRRRACRIAARWALNQVRMALLGRLDSHRLMTSGDVFRGVSVQDLNDLLGTPAEGAALRRADSPTMTT